LFDIEAQQGKDKEVVMTAKLSVSGMKGKWYQRNEIIMSDIKAGENGRECPKGDKYDFKQDGDTYTLTITNPMLEDDGTYILLVKEVDAKTSGYLTVKKRDPEYWFVRPLKEQELGYTNRPYSMSVEISEPGVNLKWLKNGAIINWADVSCIKKDEGCVSSIYFPNCVEDDTSYYSATILEFMKNGEEDQTNCWFQVDEYPHTFTSKLKAVNCVEKDTVEFNIDTEASDAEVTWYLGTKKIVPDGEKIIASGEGTKRKLVIKNVTMKDAGEITCKTNKDKSTAKLHVGILNEITKAVTSDAYRSIAGMVFAVEREDVALYVEVKDPDAPVYFYINGKKLDESNFRFEHTNINGAHTFFIKRTELAEAGILEARTPLNKDEKELTSCTTLDVMMGERKPTMGKIGKNNKVEATAGKHCQFDVPFSVEGKKQSELSIKIMGNDGKELKDGQDINITMHDGKISVNVINPKRAQSGNFKIIVGNDQGTCEQDVDVNIMDKPNTPATCTVNQVFHDNCMVNFAPPDDDGGTEIVKYIIEEMNVSEGGGWSQVAEVGPNEKKAKIEGLTSGDKYRFRVKAVNKLGESNPCEMKGGDICIKDPWGPPTQPGKPNILDWGPDFCDVSFALPESDGGAKITHYQVEWLENKMTEFVKGPTFTTKEVQEKQGLVHAKIKNLIEGYQYSFRVKAINLGSTGLWNYSPPSDPSATMTAKTRYAKASFKEPGMHDIEVKAGKTFRFDIWFQGEPEPDVTWEREGCSLASDDSGRVSIEYSVKNGTYCEKNSVLTVTKADRKEDTGLYKIRLSCGGGSTEASGHVNVIDVPTRPRGFQTDEVRAEYCRLSWEAPEDDGGVPISNYVVNMMDLSQNEWVTVAEPNDKSAEIKGLKPGHLYRFEVVAANKEGLSPPARLKDPVKAENPYCAPASPTDVKIVDFDEQSVTLRWNKPVTDGGRPISHYIIQKKDEFGGWFEALVTDDANCCATIAELEARVPGLSLGKKYQFRVVACTKAGESEPSHETKPHLCRYKNLSPSIDKGSGGSKMVKLNRLTCFQIKVKGEPAPTFSWFKDDHKVVASEAIMMYVTEHPDSAEQSSIVTLQIPRTQMTDAGKFSLFAENSNGSDHIDIDLIVIDDVPVCDCDMFLNGSLECTCNNRYRSENSDKEMARMSNGIDHDIHFAPSLISIGSDIPLHGVVGGVGVGLKPNCDLELLSDSVRRNIDVMFMKN